MAKETPTQRVMKELRVEFFRNHMSQSDIANLTGLSASAVSRRINCDVIPNLDELHAFAAAANATLDVALTTTPASASSPDALAGASSVGGAK